MTGPAAGGWKRGAVPIGRAWLSSDDGIAVAVAAAPAPKAGATETAVLGAAPQAVAPSPASTAMHAARMVTFRIAAPPSSTRQAHGRRGQD